MIDWLWMKNSGHKLPASVAEESQLKQCDGSVFSSPGSHLKTSEIGSRSWAFLCLPCVHPPQSQNLWLGVFIFFILCDPVMD